MPMSRFLHRYTVALCANISYKRPALYTPVGSRWTSLDLLSYAIRRYTTSQEYNNINVNHSKFIAEGTPGSQWNMTDSKPGKIGDNSVEKDFDKITEGKGKLSPTATHLFKLILPLGHLDIKSTVNKGENFRPPSTIILLHPSQPLSHVSRLITASLSLSNPSVSFRNTSPGGRTFQWSDSTDFGDFVRDAARVAEFSIHIVPTGGSSPDDETVINVEVPTFDDRTRFLRRRLVIIHKELSMMEAIKGKCDHEAHVGARRMAIGGLGMLVIYWGVVARLTFWDFGWDFMEPITYLSGLSTVIVGYFWFLYQGREVSYSSVLDQSISARREALYRSRGLDNGRRIELIRDAKSLRSEIRKIAEDYDEGKRFGEHQTEQQQRKDSEVQVDEDGDKNTGDEVGR